MRRIYLDANGSTPALLEVKEEVPRLVHLFGNPSSFHEEGRLLRAKIDEARHIIGLAINAHEKDVVFTSGASESNRLFSESLCLWARMNNRKLTVLMSPFEHPSLLKPLMKAHESGHIELNFIGICPSGQLEIKPDEISSCDVLIVCQAHNETGLIPPINDFVAHIGPKTLVMSDISQGFSRLSPPDERISVMTFSAQKMGGFAGVGGVVFRGLAKALPAPWLGGGQERGFRPGTESSLLILAFKEAARHTNRLRQAHKHMGELRDYFEVTLSKSALIKVIGQGLSRLPNTSAVCFLNEDADALRIACDMAGLSVGFGAACSGLAPEGSFALKRLGLNLAEEKSTVRFSFCPDIVQADIDETIHRLINQVLSRRSRV